MRIVIDTDGVIRDFHPALIKRYKECYPTHKVLPITNWNMSKFFPIGKDIHDFYCKTNPDIFYIASPTKGAINFLKQLKKDGHYIILATSQRCLDTQILTMGWYKKHEIPHDDIVFTKDKSTINADILIDDSPEQLTMALYTPMIVLPFTQAWNIVWQTRFRDGKDKENQIKQLKRLSDIDKFEEIYKEIKVLTLKEERTKFNKSKETTCHH